ncbi:MAG: sulfonate ABC transporter permease [Caulobacterales bacterium 32-69-10]|nr:MAG: sulfonate ABC transporter permease [Caulobacterales bacterium 32-69-10]
MRMLAAMLAALVFTFAFGALAARSRRAEQVMIPLLDILQSVPVLGFLSFTVTGFMALFPGQTLGVELAAIFAIFTSQAWNMAYSFYHSTKTIPRDLRDLSDSMRLGAWRRFWTLDAPYAAPSLIWNAMISMSGAWFFVVASEAISVGRTTVSLPGVGSYVALAIEQHDLRAVGWAVLTMFLVILVYDQLLFRPLVAWAEKFRLEPAAADAPAPSSWVLDFLQRAHLFRRVFRPLRSVLGSLASVRLGRPVDMTPALARVLKSRYADWSWYGALALIAGLFAWRAADFIGAEVGWAEVGWTMVLGFFTLLRVVVLVALASAVWLPLGVWIGLRPRWAAAMQPVTQFLAAFPANLLFPLVVAGIVRYRLTPDIWLSPLMILGAQWYILFNVIAGARMFPADLLEAAASMRIKGWTWWRKVVLPGIMPAYVTGAVTAGGGAWNAAIVAEVASWGPTRLQAHGLGAYIANATADGDLRRVVLGVAVMAVYVVLFNRLVWDPLFTSAARRLRAE